jgi:glucan phosphoethanolaminetransferase (alkaline phosphatase superfamily)
MNTDSFKINLNQNLWGLLLTLLALGTSEYFDLYTLYWISLILSILTSISFLVTLLAYTINYWGKRMK